MIPFTEEELKQIKLGQKVINDIDLRNLVREILHLRWLAHSLLNRCEELGDNEKNSEFFKLAAFNLRSGPRSHHESR